MTKPVPLRQIRTFFEAPSTGAVLDDLRGTRVCFACYSTSRMTGCADCLPFAVHLGSSTFLSGTVLAEVERETGGRVLSANDSFTVWGEEVGAGGDGDYFHVALAFSAERDQDRARRLAVEVLGWYSDIVRDGGVTDAGDWSIR